MGNDSGQKSAFTVTIQLISAEVPGQPVLTSVTSTTPGQTVMIWDAPASGGSPIIRYEVSYDNFVANKVDVVNTATQYTFTDRPAGATQTYYVRAVNSVGNSIAVSQSVLIMGR